MNIRQNTLAAFVSQILMYAHQFLLVPHLLQGYVAAVSYYLCIKHSISAIIFEAAASPSHQPDVSPSYSYLILQLCISAATTNKSGAIIFDFI